MTTILSAVSGLSPRAIAERKAAVRVAAPPPVVGLSTSVHRGETVDIPLRIYGTRSQTLDFRIRSQPQTGTLSAVTRTGQESASVRYTPTANIAVKRDRFSYAVSSREGVSASADIWINIVDLPPILITPMSVDFPRSMAGGNSSQEFEIANRGGGIAEGDFELTEPWSIEGGHHYRLGAGEQRTFKILFAPAVEGASSGELRYSSHPERATTLRGMAHPPLSLSPAALELQHDPESAVRAGTFAAINNTPENQTLKFTASDRLLFARIQAIAAGGRKNVVVQMSANDLSALSEEIRAEAGGYSAIVAVTAAPIAPIVRVEAVVTSKANVVVPARPDRPPDRRASPRADDGIQLVNAELPADDATISPERVPVQETTTHTATIEWPANLSQATRFKAQERHLALQGGQLKIEWIEHSGFSAEAHDDRIRATFTGLTPNQNYMMRVLPVTAQAGQTEPLLEVQFRTPSEPPRGFRITWLRALVALFLVGAGVAIWQRTKRANEFRS